MVIALGVIEVAIVVAAVLNYLHEWSHLIHSRKEALLLSPFSNKLKELF